MKASSFRARACSPAGGRKPSFPEPCQLSDRGRAGTPLRAEAPRLQGELTDERRRLLVAGAECHQESGHVGGTGSTPGFLIGGGCLDAGPSPSQSIFQIQCLSTGWPARESGEGGRAGGDRGRRPSASGAPGGLQKGAEKGEWGRGKHPAPPNLDSFPWWASSLSAGLAPSPHDGGSPEQQADPLAPTRPLQGLLATQQRPASVTNYKQATYTLWANFQV